MAMPSTYHLTWLAALTALVAAPASAAPSCASYAADLAQMREAAEAVRARVDFLAPPGDTRARHRAGQLDLVERTNAYRLMGLLEHCGWPRAATTGARAAAFAWALAQPASTDLRFQKQLLRHLEAAVANSDAPARYLAITADRVALLEERPQLYGTQLRPVDACTWNYYPLDHRERVEARRKAAGLEPLDEYKRRINEMIVTENCPPQPPSPISSK